DGQPGSADIRRGCPMTLLTTSFWQPTGADERETSLGDELAARARQMPDRLALAATPAGRPGELARWTWAEIASEAEAGARALLSVFQPGTRIGVWAPNYAEWVLLFHSAATAGMHLVPLNPMLQK